MKHLPDDLLRIILAFASPTVGARQLAARARTLDEVVEFRPSNDLRPLSLALPELRIRMHGDESTGMTPKGAPCGGWWHARCGHDWTDPVFF